MAVLVGFFGPFEAPQQFSRLGHPNSTEDLGRTPKTVSRKRVSRLGASPRQLREICASSPKN